MPAVDVRNGCRSRARELPSYMCYSYSVIRRERAAPRAALQPARPDRAPTPLQPMPHVSTECGPGKGPTLRMSR